MRISPLTFALAAILSLAACNPGVSDGTRRSIAGTEYPGIWLQKKDADELRSTGKMDSYCPELKRYPNSKVINSRLIEPSGNVYAYDPAVPNRFEMKIGVLQPDGKLKSSEFAKLATGGHDMKASVKDGILHIAVDSEGSVGIEYVRSNAAEIKRYVTALDNCRN